jgi:hypothetical protein
VSSNIKNNIHRSYILPILCLVELWSCRDIPCIANDEAGLEEQEYVILMRGEGIQFPKRRMYRQDEMTYRLLQKLTTSGTRYVVQGDEVRGYCSKSKVIKG